MARHDVGPGPISACGRPGWGPGPRSSGPCAAAAGPVTFVERQIAHVWAASMVSIAVLFHVEMILGLPVLTLSPVLGLVGGMVFLVKAGTLSGQFYFQAAALFTTAAGHGATRSGWKSRSGSTLFGVVSAGCFFFPGLKYYRQRERADAAE